MKIPKLWLIIILIVAILGFTNPSKEDHIDSIVTLASTSTYEEVVDEEAPSSDFIGTWQNGAGYHWETLKVNQKVGDSAWYTINFLDKDGNVFDSNVTLKYYCREVSVENGIYSFKSNYGGSEFRFEVSSFAHYSIQTAPWTTRENDSVVITFIMAEEDRPFYNCPPKFEEK